MDAGICAIMLHFVEICTAEHISSGSVPLKIHTHHYVCMYVLEMIKMVHYAALYSSNAVYLYKTISILGQQMSLTALLNKSNHRKKHSLHHTVGLSCLLLQPLLFFKADVALLH